MQLNLYGISCILTGITSLSMAIVVYIKGYKNRLARIWSLFAISAAFYGFGAYMVTTAKSASEAFFWWQVAYVGIILLPFIFVLLVYEFLDIKHPLIIKFFGILTIIFLISNIFFKKLFINNCTLYFTDIKLVTPIYFVYPTGPLLFFFITFAFFGWILYAHIEIFRKYKTIRGLKRSQAKYFFSAAALGFAGGGASFLPCFGIGFYPFFNFTVPIYFLTLSYAILRYRLMDIKVAITRTGIFIAVYTLVLGVPFAVAIKMKNWLIESLGSTWWMFPLILMAVLATVGPFLYIFIQRKAEDRLLREQKRYQDTLKQASVGMTRIRNLNKLLDLIAHIVTKTVKISYAAIYLYNKDTNEYVLQISRDKDRIPIPKVTADNPLVAWIMVRRDPLIYEEVKRKTEDTNDATYKLLEENMRLLTAAVIIPSFLEDRFIGFFVLGDKNSGAIYTLDDLNVFQVLASQAALAIENAQFYEDAKDMQEQIAQAEKMATIGTMADGLSHQINNRFYALSLITGDTIDTVKNTDTSKCTPEVRAMIDEINHALERIQTNVMQGGEVVRGILKYSRKGDGAFEALELNKVLDNTLEMVQYKVKLSEIDIVRDFDSIPKIKGNITQLEEAFFNFIDNAYDAICERRDTLKEEGYRGRVTISAQPKDKYLEIIIQDNGMGVKDANNTKIFTPFFTTKTSSRKGTGLGLYVIKRIITDTHRGRIAFESQYQVGTRFILELPIAK